MRNLSILTFENFSFDVKLFLLKLLIYIPVPLLIIGLNYTIDPANLFKDKKYEAGIAEYLLHGYNVANVKNYDEGFLQIYYINHLSEKKDIIAIGSSRSMFIKSGFFRDKSFFNNSISGATIKDYIAIYGMYKKKNFIPSLLILGLDPWILNKNLKENPFGRSLNKSYQEFIAISQLDKNIFSFSEAIGINSKYLELVSIGYFKETLNSIKKEDKLSKYYPTKNYIDDNTMRYFDGSLAYDKEKRSISILDVRKIAIRDADKAWYGLDSFYELDSNKMKQLELFINILLHDNVQVIFFLPPYHPKYYEIMVKSKKYKINDSEIYFRNLARIKNIKLIGSFNPDNYSLTEEDFYDGFHPKELLIKKVFSNIL